MSKKKVLRIISLIMLIVAVVFVICAISAPTLGQVIYIGEYEFGPEQWRICYAAYAVVMVLIFVASFFVKGSSKKK